MPTLQQRDVGWENVCLTVPENGALEQLWKSLPNGMFKDVYLAYAGTPSLKFSGFLVTAHGNTDQVFAFCPMSNGLELGSALWRTEVRQQLRVAVSLATGDARSHVNNFIDLRPESLGASGIPGWVYGLNCVPLTHSWNRELQQPRPFCAKLFSAMASQPEAREWIAKNTPEQEPGETRPAISRLPSLKDREEAILKRMCTGMSEREIAESLSMSPHTVHANIKRIYRAFKVKSRSRLLAVCLGGAPEVVRNTSRVSEPATDEA